MAYSDLKNQIIDQDLCARCGGCVAICPKQMLEIENNGEPFSLFSPETINMNCGSCTLCLDICPGKETGVIASENRLFGRARNSKERWTGIFKNTFLATSTDSEILNKASAGGIVTSLLIAALRIDLVDAVIVIGRDDIKRWMPKAIITNDEDIIKKAAQSSYCLAPNLQLLRDTPYKRVGIVGVPCEIQSINKMKNTPEANWISEKIIFTIEIGCASSTKIAGTEHLIEKNLGLDLNEVKDVRYRDGEYPGQFTVYTDDNKKHELPFHELVDTFKKFKTYRCLSCPDWWSGLADISIADGDPNIYAASIHKTGTKRCSTVMTRTDMGEYLLDQAIKIGIIEVEPFMFNPEESLGLQRKRFRSSNYARKFPDKVPNRPVADDVLDELKNDDDVISSMSSI